MIRRLLILSFIYLNATYSYSMNILSPLKDAYKAMMGGRRYAEVKLEAFVENLVIPAENSSCENHLRLFAKNEIEKQFPYLLADPMFIGSLVNIVRNNEEQKIENSVHLAASIKYAQLHPESIPNSIAQDQDFVWVE